MLKQRRLTTWVLATSLIAQTAAAAPADSAKDGFDYPELLVTPRASERLKMEAERENSRKWVTHLPLQVSALTTLTAGLVQLGNYSATKDVDGTSPYAGLAVGAGWLVTSSLLAMQHRPYTSAHQEVSALPKGSKREQLAQERMAEEALESTASLGRKLTWLSVLTNAGASIYMLGKAEKNSASIVADGIALAAAFAPVVFPYHWKKVEREQRDYKKKIYAPIATGGVMAEPATGRPAPSLALSFRF